MGASLRTRVSVSALWRKNAEVRQHVKARRGRGELGEWDIRTAAEEGGGEWGQVEGRTATASHSTGRGLPSWRIRKRERHVAMLRCRGESPRRHSG